LLAQAVANGVVLGALFALLGAGLTLTYGVLQVPNFAQAGGHHARRLHDAVA
jgi:branched-chain amino acid transport system permease protein